MKKEQAREAKRLEIERRREQRRAKQVENNKENSSSTSSRPKQYPTRKAPKTLERFAQTSDDVCAVCVGTYADDVDESSNVIANWI